MKIIKTIGTSLIISLMTISFSHANDFGVYNTNAEFEASYDESLAAVEASKELRRSLRNDRSIAGMKAQDEKWANEFNRIMADNKTDYLKKAYQLND